METKIYTIDTAKSVIGWIGKKVTGAHNGTINIADGKLIFIEGYLSGGEFSIDTTSIRGLDIVDLAANQQFAGHLASDDFFATEKYPIATLIITNVSRQTNGSYHIAASLTIKDITHAIEFDAEVGDLNGGPIYASARIVIDRTRFGMRFRSGNFFKDLGDSLIYNDFILNVKLTALPPSRQTY